MTKQSNIEIEIAKYLAHDRVADRIQVAMIFIAVMSAVILVAL
jgi:hypothetical protein